MNMKHKGQLRISRWHGTTGTGITISVTDETSGTTFLEADITVEALGRALTSEQVDCEFELRAMNVGKVREHKVETIPFPITSQKEFEKKARAAVAPFEVDGWSGDWRSLGNHHRGSASGYKIGFSRFVEPAEAEK